MNSKGILSLVKQHGVAAVVKALLLRQDDEDYTETLRKQARFIGCLTAMLEKRKILRRGHVIDLICTSTGIPQDPESGVDNQK